ncbi:hypothetical protein GUJ93_ZPchr0006g45815 [Zizania palustris]|uniref:Uncharacterized protein n=1 Tax=Zizania palustris TaxID=103762 RepID=A0A8J5SYN0_ZIZPA|nr:hypothetical protein GUJ93_ZPchr0006g45815 [Zizania palustris]
MASMMGGDFVEAYVLRNAYKEKLRRMEAAPPPATDGKKVEGVVGSAGEKKTSASGCGSRGGMFGLMKKKKVHPKASVGVGHENQLASSSS